MGADNHLGPLGKWAEDRHEKGKQEKEREMGAAAYQERRKRNPFNSAGAEMVKKVLGESIRLVNISADVVDKILPDKR
jgi:hypothetical protein